MMKLLAKLTLLTLFVILVGYQHQTIQAQRSLHHWKHDLQHRIRLYKNHRHAIQNILSSSIYPARDDIMLVNQNARTTVKISTNGNVRFSDLVIPSGSLKLGPHIVRSTVHILVNKTRSYVESKSNELTHIRNQLDTIERQLNDPARHYIYKGIRGQPQPDYNTTSVITGTRVFKRVEYAHLIEAKNVTVPKVNYTDVTRVIDDTYMRNTKFGVSDSKGRLYFEGRKTFWNTVFTRPLKSGCCDRLKPLHTSRMMLRSLRQDVSAPILFYSGSNPYYLNQPQVATIQELSTPLLYNGPVQLNPRGPTRPDDIGLLLPPANVMPQPDNRIRLSDLISTRHFGQPEILKTLVFKDVVIIDEALLSNSFVDNRLVIGLADQPGFAFDLAHDNYLLKFSTLPKNFTQPIQQVAGKVILEAGAHFLADIQANSVNRIDDFVRFAHETIVRTNRPATIRGPVQFNALPTVLNNRQSAQLGGPSELRRPHNVLIMRASSGLEVGQVNGMQIPNDIVLMPSVPGINAGATLRPDELIHVHGPRQFENQVVCHDHLQVSGLVNGIQMPGGVVPLHLNDFINSAGTSNLWFIDGITVHHMTIQGSKFDEINLRDVNGDAQSIIMRSMSVRNPDGSVTIRAPLQVTNLHLIQKSDGSGGRLNGFRPQEVIELNARYPYESMYGRKKFAAPVEAAECIFSDINNVRNWTNHLIRIDRPNTVQTVHTRLAFNNQQHFVDANNSIQQKQQQPPPYLNQSFAHVNIDRLNVEFHPETNQVNYEQNWNFSPGFYLLHQAMLRAAANYTGGRYRVLDQVKVIAPTGSASLVNGIALNDIVRLDEPFRFADTFTMVGKVEVKGSLSADRIRSNYPIDAMDLVQFNKYRIPIISNSRAPIKLNSLVLGQDNRASFIQSRLLNGIPLNDFINSIMSLTKPQSISSNLTFSAPINFEAMLNTRSSLNGVKNFNRFARDIKDAKYIFDDGLQCNAVVIKT